MTSYKSIMHYHDKPSRFIKVTASLHKHISQLRAHIEKGMNWADDQFWNTTFESSVPSALRFMVDNWHVLDYANSRQLLDEA